jgi:cobalamin 5'-phosphate synthase/cobalamin synthase
MRALAAAVAFLTRIPVPLPFSAEDVGRAARWFPLVGALLGAVYVGIAHVNRLPATVTAVLIVLAEALLTGALHMDGLADTADGFGGGRTRDDILRIMRDHAIGSYGAVALIVMIALKITAISALLERGTALPWLILAPALGRWAIVPLCRFVAYARESKSVASHVGTVELVWATVLAAAAVAALAPLQGAIVWTLVALAAALFARFCVRRIGGITGDTLGATVQIAECLTLVAGLALA